MLLLFRIAIMLCVLVANNVSWAGSYADGYNKYIQGDFAGAESAFQSALRSEASPYEKARIYKMLGISQYMLGKRSAAESSFSNAKTLNPKTAITSAEVLDESVVGFFDSIQAREIPQVAPAAAPEPRAGETGARTVLLVDSNARNARVAVNGVNKGAAGTTISLEPGKYEVEVSAEGYETVSLQVEVSKGITNRTTINLTRKSGKTTPPPAEEIAPVVAEKEVSKGPDDNGKSEEKKKPTKKRSKKKKKKAAEDAPAPPSASKGSFVTNMLPFGLPQVFQDKYLFGILFGTGQVVGLLLGISNSSKEAAIVDETNSEIAKRQEQEANIEDSDEADKFHEETLKYHDEQTAKSDAAYQSALMGFVIFGAIWAGSILEAFLNPPRGAAVADNGSNERGRYTNLYNGQSLWIEDRPEPRFHVNLLPVPHTFFSPSASTPQAPAARFSNPNLALDLRWEF